MNKRKRKEITDKHYSILLGISIAIPIGCIIWYFCTVFCDNVKSEKLGYAISIISILAPICVLLGLSYINKAWWLREGLTKEQYTKGRCATYVLHIVSYVDACVHLLKLHNMSIESQIIIHLLGMAILLFISTYQLLFRLTFRRWPNIAIAFSVTVLYLSLVSIWVCRDMMDKLANYIADIPSILKGSVIVVAVGSTLISTISSPVTEYLNHKTTETAHSMRRIRRKLLSHWCYKPSSLFYNRTNVIHIICTAAVCSFIIAFLVITSCDPFIARTIQLDGSSTTEQILTISMYLFFISAIAGLSGLVGYWYISDDELLKSEYRYIMIQSSLLKENDIIKGTPRWRDYCQVIVNLYSNISGISSEDKHIHKLNHILEKAKKFKGDRESCASIKFIGDIVFEKGDLLSDKLRLAKNESYRDTDLIVQQAKDVIFTNDFGNIGQGSPSDVREKLENYNLLQILFHAGDLFFGEETKEIWAQRFGPHNVTAEEGINLLKNDAITYFLKRQSASKCCLAWCGCPWSRAECDGDKNTKEFKMEVIITYPYIIFECFNKRWHRTKTGKQDHSEDMLYYFRDVFLDSYKVSCTDVSVTLNNCFSFLAETEMDPDSLDMTVTQLTELQDRLEDFQQMGDSTSWKKANIFAQKICSKVSQNDPDSAKNFLDGYLKRIAVNKIYEFENRPTKDKNQNVVIYSAKSKKANLAPETFERLRMLVYNLFEITDKEE